MVAINFPDSPTNGQEHEGYVWDATNNVWNRLPTLPALDLVNFSAVAPTNPQDGQFWFDTTVGKMYVYYNDGSSSQWVSAIGGLASQTGTTGQVLTYDGTEWVADDLPASGKILQVVSTTKTDTFSTSSTSFTAITGLSASITPSSASSKVLIIGQVSLGFPNSVSDSGSKLLLSGGNTSAYKGDTASNRTRAIMGARSAGSGATQYQHGNTLESETIVFLDSPATTSSVTYGFEIASNTANSVFVNRAGEDGDTSLQTRGASSITVMEVAG